MYLSVTIDKAMATSSKWLEQLQNMSFAYLPKIFWAIILYIVGIWLIKKLSKWINRLLDLRGIDKSAKIFLSSFINGILIILLLVSVANIIGIDTTSIAALLAGTGIAIGAALNGTLGNLAGGIILIIYKPFKIGDLIESQTFIGTVIEIGIFHCKLEAPDRSIMILPNSLLTNQKIANYHNQHHPIRVDIVIMIDLDNDIDKARELAINTLLNHDKILKDPKPEVVITQIADASIQLGIRPYTHHTHYWTVKFDTQELIKKAFDNAGIKSFVPKREIITKNL